MSGGYDINVTRSSKYVRELAGDAAAVECPDCEQAAGRPCVNAAGFSQSRPCRARVRREVELRPPDIAARLRAAP